MTKHTLLMRRNEEDALIVTMNCLLAIAGVVALKIFLKLDFQSWAAVYAAAALIGAIRHTAAGTSLSIGSGFRAFGCLVLGLIAIRLAGYPASFSFHSASLVPREILEALSHFHIYFD